jgi:dolichol-phosphate mannosyltransferase
VSPERRVLVIVPTYEERDTIGTVIDRTLGATDADLLVIDDTSPDGTGEFAVKRSIDEPRLHVLHRAGKQGLGSAYREGFVWGLERGYDVLVEMDADLSHDPLRLPELIASTSEADLVVGSRYVPGGDTRNWSAVRRMLSWGGNRYVQLLTGVPVRDATSGFRAFRREVLEALDVTTLHAEGYSFQIEGVLRTWSAGFAITEIPITFTERSSGASKISRAIIIEAIWRVLAWSLRGRRGRRTRS